MWTLVNPQQTLRDFVEELQQMVPFRIMPTDGPVSDTPFGSARQTLSMAETSPIISQPRSFGTPSARTIESSEQWSPSEAVTSSGVTTPSNLRTNYYTADSHWDSTVFGPLGQPKMSPLTSDTERTQKMHRSLETSTEEIPDTPELKRRDTKKSPIVESDDDVQDPNLRTGSVVSSSGRQVNAGPAKESGRRSMSAKTEMEESDYSHGRRAVSAPANTPISSDSSPERLNRSRKERTMAKIERHVQTPLAPWNTPVSSDTSPERHSNTKAREKNKTKSRLNYANSGSEDDEDGQRWTPPQRREKKTRTDTPDPRHEPRVTFRRGHDESSDSDDSYIPSTQQRHYLKPPKFDGKSAFETFYAHFENCAKFNLWDRSEKLANLKAALVENAGQVLWDNPLEITDSLSRLVKLLKERFGGAAQSDKYRMELRNRRRQKHETLQDLHSDVRRLMVLAYPQLDATARETMGCDYFLDSLEDPAFKLKIREKNPGTLDEALKIGLLLEVWKKDAASSLQDDKAKAKNVRNVGTDGGSAVKALSHQMTGLTQTVNGLATVMMDFVRQQRPVELSTQIQMMTPNKTKEQEALAHHTRKDQCAGTAAIRDAY